MTVLRRNEKRVDFCTNPSLTLSLLFVLFFGGEFLEWVLVLCPAVWCSSFPFSAHLLFLVAQCVRRFSLFSLTFSLPTSNSPIPKLFFYQS